MPALTTASVTILSFVLSLVYAIVRYNVLQDVDWSHVPLYIMNKAISLTAVVLLAAAYLARPRKGSPPRLTNSGLSPVRIALMGLVLANVHVVLSLCLLQPAYYGKLFDPDGKMNLAGEATMLFGVIGWALLTIPAIMSLPGWIELLGAARWRRYQQMAAWVAPCVALHLLTIGLAGWLTPRAWPGYMPPITLIAFFVMLVPPLVAGWRLLRPASGKAR